VKSLNLKYKLDKNDHSRRKFQMALRGFCFELFICKLKKKKSLSKEDI